MARLKVTGYIEADDLDDADRDDSHVTGLSERGWDEIQVWSLGDLHDLKVEPEVVAP
jgi:hypothetical protein